MYLGTSGVRLSNAEWLAQNYYTFLNPSARQHKLYNPDTDISVALEDCIDDTQASNANNGFQSYVGSLTSVYGYFKDHLMPVMRSTHASSTEAFCSRFVLELARLEALLYVDQATKAATPNPEIATQRTVVDLWRLRCLTQVRMVGLCNLHGVFDLVPTNYTEPSCPFTVEAGCPNSYVTHDCIVYCNGSFHDPCLCAEAAGLSSCVGYAWVPGAASCPLSFDPRSMDDESIRLSTMTPPQTFPAEEILASTLTTSEMVALAAKIAAYEAAYLNVYDPSGAAAQYLQNDIVQSSKGGEGMLSGTSVGAQEFCDAVMDYWPSDWVHPNGYHVTTGCKQNETAYRGYDGWMSVGYDPATGQKYLVLDSRRLRNETLFKNYLGGSGACSAASYGMPMWNTNNARLQTRWQDGQAYDPTQPTPPTTPPGVPNYIESQPAPDWTQVPTRGAIGDNSMPSSGLLYHWWPYMAKVATLWPMAADGMGYYELPAGATAQWGSECGQLPLKACLNDTDCGALNGATLVCLRAWSQSKGSVGEGVCALQGTEPLECYQNYHCQGKDQVCSGEGRCVDPYLLMRNRAGYATEMHVHSATCAVESLGYSPWQNVTDFLSRNGMCGFRDWFEYEDMLRRGANSTGAPGSLAPIRNGVLWYSTDPSITDTEIKKSLFERGILKVSPHTCDRDYAYLLPSCTGNPSAVLNPLGSPVSGYQYGETMRTWRAANGNWELDMCVQDHMPRTRTGFLYPYMGYGGEDTFGNVSMAIKLCSTLQLCSEQDFYVMGFKVLHRKVNRLLIDGSCATRTGCVAAEYTLQDALYCGAVGYLTALNPTSNERTYGTPCRVDPLVSPVVRMFCSDLATLQATCELDPAYATASGVSTLCNYYQSDYNYNTAQQIDSELNTALLKFFKRGFTTWGEYQARATCAMGVYSLMLKYADEQSALAGGTGWYAYELDPGVYTYMLPYMSMYVFNDASQMEIPMKWWVQCVLLDETVNVDLLIGAGADQVQCNGWQNSQTGGFQATTMKEFLQSSSALYLESGTSVTTNLTDIALSIYDNLFAQINKAKWTVSSAMGDAGRYDDFNLSYVFYRKLKDLYLTSASYNAYAKSSDTSQDNNPNRPRALRQRLVPRRRGPAEHIPAGGELHPQRGRERAVLPPGGGREPHGQGAQVVHPHLVRERLHEPGERLLQPGHGDPAVRPAEPHAHVPLQRPRRDPRLRAAGG
eukprot:51850-Hanusia_phi.AAC.2